MTTKRVKKQCEVCCYYTFKIRLHKNRRLCYNCYIKEANLINDGGFIGKNLTSLEKALKKVYEPRGYLTGSKKKRVVCALSLPSIFIGHKIKVILADDDKREGLNSI